MRNAIKTPLGKMTVALALVVVTVIVFGTIGYLTNRWRIIDATNRQDCRARVAAEFNEKVKASNSANAKVLTTFVHTITAHTPPGTPLTAAENRTIDRANNKAITAAKAVVALPMLNHAIDHGYTLDGVHHGPCPSID